jgi:hypothetical protein
MKRANQERCANLESQSVIWTGEQQDLVVHCRLQSEKSDSLVPKGRGDLTKHAKVVMSVEESSQNTLVADGILVRSSIGLPHAKARFLVMLQLVVRRQNDASCRWRHDRLLALAQTHLPLPLHLSLHQRLHRLVLRVLLIRRQLSVKQRRSVKP